MASFEDNEDRIFKQLFNDEGIEFTNIKNDRGGETKFGITWVAVKTAIAKGVLGKNVLEDKNFIKNMDEQTAKIIYKACYWDELNLNKMVYQEVAEKIFNMSVVFGINGATKCAQRAYRSVYQNKNELKEDGIFGQKTLNAINSCYYSTFLAAFRSECAARFRLIAATNKSQKIFLNGWLNRAYR